MNSLQHGTINLPLFYQRLVSHTFEDNSLLASFLGRFYLQYLVSLKNIKRGAKPIVGEGGAFSGSNIQGGRVPLPPSL